MNYTRFYDNVVQQPQLSEDSTVVNAVSLQVHSGDVIADFTSVEIIDIFPVINAVQNYHPMFQDEIITKIFIELIYSMIEAEDYLLDITDHLSAMSQTFYAHASFRGGVYFELSSPEHKQFILHISDMLNRMVCAETKYQGTFIGWRENSIVVGMASWL